MDTNQGYKILENIMEKLDPKIDGSSKNIIQENIDKLKTIFPDVFTESKVDFDRLKETLGQYIEDNEERYSFSWHGKSRARRISQTPSTGTLRPCKEESKNWDTTQNLFIEGDNLEVLKLLQKTYHKKVKMIYIDPPYNTGREFIYPDNYKDNLDTYLKYTGQIDDEGSKFSSNSEQSGRYHTNWLNMMYPRLKLARNLLRDDGVIFISIDDNEQSNLKKICDEIFGEDNFINGLIWKKRDGAPNDRKMGSVHEHILVFGKNKSNTSKKTKAEESFNLMPRTDKANAQYKIFNEPDGPDKRGPFRKIDATATGKGGRFVKSLYYPIENPYTKEMVYPRDGTCWRHSKENMALLQKEQRLYWGVNGTAKTPMRKLFLSETKQGMTTPSILPNMPFNQHAAREIEIIFDRKSIYETPKPVDLIKLFIQIGTQKEDLVLDFFSGSCSTANAVLNINKEDKGTRRFIMVQLPEPCKKDSDAFKAGYITISDIGKERIRRAGERIVEENQDQADIENIDIGFKVFKLASSNSKPWDTDFDHLEDALWDSVNNIKTDRTEADVLYELLLKYGLDLTLPIEERKISGKTVFSIGLGALVICLDSDITIDVVEGIGKLKQELDPEIMRVVFKDSGFKNDVVKTNAIQILKQYNIEDVKSL